MNFDQFIRVIRARLWLVIGVALSIIVLTVLVSWWLPKTYQSTATVMVDARPDPVSVAGFSTLPPAAYLATQVDIIKSPAVALRVVRALQLNESADLRKKWETDAKGRGDYLAWVADMIGKGLRVRPSRESNVIEIAYEGGDPRFSAALANAFARAYIESTVQLRVDPARRYADFFEERARLARDKLEAAQTKLTQAQKEKGIVVTEERLDVETARLNDLGTQITGLRMLKAETGSRSSVAQANPDRVTDVLSNPVVSAIKTELARVEARLEELSSRFGDAHPQVMETRANLASLNQRLRNETSKVTTSVALSNRVSTEREAQALADYEVQRLRVLKMKEDRGELQVMEREVESAQRIYESIQARLSQTNLESSANQSSISLLSAATEPISHSSPKMLLNALVAMTIGTFLGVMSALGIELLDRKVRGPYDLVQALDLPVIGVVPAPVSKRSMFSRLSGPAREANSRVMLHRSTGNTSLDHA